MLSGGLAALLAGFGWVEPVLALLVPEVAWFLCVPAVLLLFLGLAGFCASRRAPSKLLQAQLAVFSFLGALLLAAAGVFVFHYAAAASHWVFDGCVHFRTEGIWPVSRLAPKLKEAHAQYTQLACGFTRCRKLNPLSIDLGSCGPRAECEGGPRVDSLPFFTWMQHLQVVYHCGGFCQAEVPLFGLTSMEETLHERPACVDTVVELLMFVGRGFGTVAAVISLPVFFAALRVACAAGRELDDTSSSDEMREPLSGRPERSHRKKRADAEDSDPDDDYL